MVYQEFLAYCNEHAIDPTEQDIYITSIRPIITSPQVSTGQYGAHTTHDLFTRYIQAEKARLFHRTEVPIEVRTTLEQAILAQKHIIRKYDPSETILANRYVTLFDDTGISVQIFLTKKEAEKEISKQLQAIEDDYDKKIKQLRKNHTKDVDILKKEKNQLMYLVKR